MIGISLSMIPERNSKVELTVGNLKVLFSYGEPVGLDFEGNIVNTDAANRVQQRHLYTWRPAYTQTRLPHQEFSDTLLFALDQQLRTLRK